MTTASSTVAAPAWEWRDPARGIQTLAAGLIVVALQWVHGVADGFLYDAAQYWAASVALVSGGDVASAGVLQLRGTLTAIVYVPPALLTALLGPASAGWTVLAWNSMLAALLCVVLLPRIAALIAPGPSAWRMWIAAVVGGVVVSGFARYPLLDVWAVTFALAGLYGVATARRWWIAAAAGFALVVATNLRPAYIAPVLIAVALVMLSRPRLALWVIPGAAVGIAPQVIFNLAAMNRFSLVPVETPFLMSVQAAYATFATRYDTVLAPDRHPAQFYCDPGYASLQVSDVPPTSTLRVLASAVSHLPDSLGFFSAKAAASLHWSFATPYEHPPGPGTSVMTMVVLSISVAGLVALIWRAVAVWKLRPQRFVSLALLGFWVGALATLVLSTPETRFALPLILIGLIGSLAVAPGPVLRVTPHALIAAGISILLIASLFGLGKAALSAPMPPGGNATLAACAAQM